MSYDYHPNAPYIADRKRDIVEARAKGDKHKEAQALIGMGMMLSQMRYEGLPIPAYEVMGYFESALAAVSDIRDNSTQTDVYLGKIYGGIAGQHDMSGNAAAAADNFQRAIDYLRSAGENYLASSYELHLERVLRGELNIPIKRY